MENVTVEKATLIAKLTENRAKHQAAYEAAIMGWRTTVMAELENAIDAFPKDWEISDLNFASRFQKPMNHVGEYDTALEMLEWETQEVVTLDRPTFQNLVLDEWDWKYRFLASTSQYVN